MRRGFRKPLALFLAAMTAFGSVNVPAMAEDGLDHEHNSGGWVCEYHDPVTEVACTHVHSEECYAEGEKVLTCDIMEHTHGNGCFITLEDILACESQEEGHEHNEDCYEKQESELICQEPEHVHTEGCYTQERILDCKHVCDENCTRTVSEEHWDCKEEQQKEVIEEGVSNEVATFRAILDDMELFVLTEDNYDMYVDLSVRASDLLDALLDREWNGKDADLSRFQSLIDKFSEESGSYAFISGEHFTINVVKVVGNTIVDTIPVESVCMQSTGHTGITHAINLSKVVMASGFDGYSKWCYSRDSTLPDISSYSSKIIPNHNYTQVHYSLSGSEPFAAEETLFLYYPDSSIDTEPQITVTKTLDVPNDVKSVSQTFTEGDDVVWNVEVRNDSNFAVSGLKLVDTCTRDGETYDVTMTGPDGVDPEDFSLEAGASITFQSTVKNAAVGQYHNVAVVQKDGEDLGQDESDAAVEAPVKPVELSVTKQVSVNGGEYVDEAQYYPGDKATWKIVVRNTGETVANDVAIMDILDGNLTFVEAKIDRGNTIHLNQDNDIDSFSANIYVPSSSYGFSWDHSNNMYPGEEWVLTIDVTVKPDVMPGTEIHNNAVITCSNSEKNWEDSAMLTVMEAPSQHNFGDWTVTKDPDCINPGERTRTCEKCGETETDTIPALDHSWNDLEYSDNGDGTHTVTCNRCHGNLDGGSYTEPHCDFSEWVTVTDPTCTIPGEKERICGRCAAKETDEIPVLGHDFDGVEWKDDTSGGTHTAGCNSTEHYRDCKRCKGKEEGGTERSVHPYGDWKTVFEPDCVTSGYKIRECPDCPHVEEALIPMLGHDPVEDPAEDPDCIHSGKTAGSHCGRCSIVLEERETVNALGHDFTDVSWSDNHEGGHTDDCESIDHVRTCRRCDGMLKDGKESQAEEHHFGEWKTVKESTCSEFGTEERICGDCGHKESRPVAMTQHHLVVDEAVEPDCIHPGKTEGQHCEDCGYVAVEQQPIDSLGHDFKSAWIDNGGNGHTEDCTADEHQKVCDRCHGTLDSGQVSEAHDFEEWVTVKEPSCTEDGIRERHCKDCDHVESETVPAAGHDFDVISAKEPDCIHEGTAEKKICKVCGYEETENMSIPALGHDFENVDWKDDTDTGEHIEGCVSTEHVRICKRCGGSLKDGNEFQRKLHKYSEWQILKEVTETEEGLRERTCEDCGHKESELIPVLPVKTPDPKPEVTPEPTRVPTPEPVPTTEPEEQAEPVPDETFEIEKEEPAPAAMQTPQPESELDDEGVPLAQAERGEGMAWALVNFALMNLAVFESVMLLVGYFVQTKKQKKKEDDEKDEKDETSEKESEERERRLKKHGLIRLLSIIVAVAAVIAFILTEDITLPTGFVDKWTLLMLVIALVQTVIVIFSRKEEKPAYQVELIDSEEGKVMADKFQDVEPDTEVTLSSEAYDGYRLVRYDVIDEDGKAVNVEDGRFQMPESDVQVAAVFTKE